MKQQFTLLTLTTLAVVGIGSVNYPPLGLGQNAIAHMIETDYNLLDQSLEFTSTYSTGEPVPEAQVFIYAPDNPDEPWVELITDEEGRFSFTPDQSIPGEWEIHIEKDLGHQDYWTVPVNPTGIDYNNIVMHDGGGSGLAHGSHYSIGEVVAVLGLGVAAGVAAYRWKRH